MGSLTVGLVPGGIYRRRDLHRGGLGGNWQKGISYPAKGDYVLLFSNPHGRDEYGYHDRWESATVYRYFGEWSGSGDMTMTGGNRKIIERSPELHLFTETPGGYRYEGRLEFIDHQFETTRREGRTLSAIVFRLRRA